MKTLLLVALLSWSCLAAAEKADLVVVSKRESRLYLDGQKNGWGWLAPISQLFDWTDGCVALRNSDMEKVWNAVDVGTPIEIQP